WRRVRVMTVLLGKLLAFPASAETAPRRNATEDRTGSLPAHATSADDHRARRPMASQLAASPVVQSATASSCSTKAAGRLLCRGHFLGAQPGEQRREGVADARRRHGDHGDARPVADEV